MKNSTLSTILFACMLLISCANDNQKDAISGTWKLSSFDKNGEAVTITSCDQETIWNFTTEAAEALDDGSTVYKLQATAPENCQYYGFDSYWTLSEGKLFISTSRIGGMGGVSFAGLMEIKELTENKMVVSAMKKELTFTR